MRTSQLGQSRLATSTATGLPRVRPWRTPERISTASLSIFMRRRARGRAGAGHVPVEGLAVQLQPGRQPLDDRDRPRAVRLARCREAKFHGPRLAAGSRPTAPVVALGHLHIVGAWLRAAVIIMLVLLGVSDPGGGALVGNRSLREEGTGSTIASRRPSSTASRTPCPREARWSRSPSTSGAGGVTVVRVEVGDQPCLPSGPARPTSSRSRARLEPVAPGAPPASTFSPRPRASYGVRLCERGLGHLENRDQQAQGEGDRRKRRRPLGPRAWPISSQATIDSRQAIPIAERRPRSHGRCLRRRRARRRVLVLGSAGASASPTSVGALVRTLSSRSSSSLRVPASSSAR